MSSFCFCVGSLSFLLPCVIVSVSVCRTALWPPSSLEEGPVCVTGPRGLPFGSEPGQQCVPGRSGSWCETPFNHWRCCLVLSVTESKVLRCPAPATKLSASPVRGAYFSMFLLLTNYVRSAVCLPLLRSFQEFFLPISAF